MYTSAVNELRKGNCVQYRGPLDYNDSIGVIIDQKPINGKISYSLKMSPGDTFELIVAYRDQVSSIVLNHKILAELGFQFNQEVGTRIYQYKNIRIVRIMVVPQDATATGLGTYIKMV